MALQPLILATDITASAITTISSSTFPSGTALPFFQASAPTGWTISNSHHDKAMRVVSTGNWGSGSGGSTTFSTAWNSVATQATAPGTDSVAPSGTAASAGSHQHSISSDGGHSHTWGDTNIDPAGGGGNLYWVGTQNSNGTSGAGAHSHSGSTSGGDGSHSHSVTTSAHSHTVNSHTHTISSFTPSFINLIVATKD